MDPAELDRRANWFRFNATNSSITVPNKYASQLALPALLYIRGMISAAVIVGDMSAIAIAVTPLKPRQLARRPVFDSSTFSIKTSRTSAAPSPVEVTTGGNFAVLPYRQRFAMIVP